MNGCNFVRIINKYKKCPNCGASYKTTDLQCALENEVITISCKCGWCKKVSEKDI